MPKTYKVEVTYTYLIDVVAESPDEAEEIFNDYIVADDPTSYEVRVHGVGNWED